MNKNNYLLFMDETGTLSKDGQQPYFGLGILKLKETSSLLQKIYTIKNKNFHKELKFSKIKYNGQVSYIKKIIDICFEYEYFNFYAFIIDKKNINKGNSSIWNLYIKFAKQHIKENCRMEDEKICILADYLSKPKNEKSFEKSMMESDKVFNACMLESESSIFIQIVDILIGAIVYKINPNNSNKNNRKTEVCLYLEKKLTEIQEKNTKNIKEKLQYKGTINNNFILSSEKFYFSLYRK